MPTYVYECKSCHQSFEAEQSIRDAPLTDCACGGNVRRVIQPVGIAFKGSGFYVNDSVPPPAEKAPETQTETKETPAATPAPPPAAPETKSDPAT